MRVSGKIVSLTEKRKKGPRIRKKIRWSLNRPANDLGQYKVNVKKKQLHMLNLVFWAKAQIRINTLAALINSIV